MLELNIFWGCLISFFFGNYAKLFSVFTAEYKVKKKIFLENFCVYDFSLRSAICAVYILRNLRIYNATVTSTS